jgi:hypothetical protein
MVIVHGLSINKYLAMGLGLQTRTREENRDILLLLELCRSGSLLVMDLASAPKPDIN